MDNIPPMENTNPEMFDYIQLEGGIFDDNSQQYYGTAENRQHQQYHHNVMKITSRASFACCRPLLLYLFYYIEGKSLTKFLINLIIFLLIHEVLVITNYIIMKMYLLCKRHSNPGNYDFPMFCILMDTLTNLVFFAWFIYGNICILTDRKGVEESLNNNVMTTYYITVLILFGFFIFSKFIFYVIFFVSFCPCITYMFYNDLQEEYNIAKRAKRLQEKLKEITYEEYSELNGTESDMCIICTEQYKMKDKVIELPCNNKHVFHGDCIRVWISKKTICPMCRCELNPDEDNEEVPIA